MSDETNILAVSKSMLETKTVSNVTMAHNYFGNSNAANNEIPVRPLGFQFLIYVVHVLLGYCYKNVFVLNFLILFAFLSILFIFVNRYVGKSVAAATLFLVLSMPVVTIFATSGGFDFCNSVILFLALLLVGQYLRKPSSSLFALLIALLIVISNIRYESVCYLFVILAMLLTRKTTLGHCRECYPLFMSYPLLMLPYIWQFLLKNDYWSDVNEGSPFSISYFRDNILELFRNIANINFDLPYAGVLNIFALLAFIVVLVAFMTKKISFKPPMGIFICILAVVLIVYLLINLSYFFGKYTHPSCIRFFIFFSIIVALSPVFLKYVFKNISGRYILFGAIAAFLVYHPIAIEGRCINSLILNRKTNYCIDFLQELGSNSIILITDRPGQYTV
ncbi:MAG: hypothetical protein GX587_05695, partial [Bacteroidales bacterium]|nr:hypothetical protein [Bacteroidales bacterium]